jgi:RNA polymerase sigma factor (sigma-70 family)
LGLAELQHLFSEVRGELLRHLRRRTRNQDLADDLTQDVFLKLTTVQAVIPDRRHGRAYLFRMASNLAIDHGRVEARRAEILSGSHVLFENVEESPESLAEARDQLRRIEEALTELPEKCRKVLILSQIEGMRHKEIAHQLGVSVSLVEKYRLRALRHCRERLSRDD